MKKKKYKILPFIIAILIIFSAICIPSSKVMAATTGTTPDGYKYTMYNTYVVITGYSGSDTVLTIPKTIENLPVTTIGKHALDKLTYTYIKNTGLTSVTIPDSVTTIDYEVFTDYKNLASINVAVGNTKYKSVDGVLFNINETELIKYPQGITNPNYTIPNGINTIGSYAFQSCTNLTSVSIPDSVTSIGDHAFAYTGLTNVTIPNSVITIDRCAFGWSALKSVIIPNSVTTISDSTFYGCNNLANVDIPNSVTTIGESAFGNSGLTNVIIPDSVTTIGIDAFYGCKSLVKVTIPDSVTVIDNGAFGSTGLTSITIPDSVTTIGKNAFYNFSLSGLTSLTIKNSLTNIDSAAFTGCTNLTSANITIYQNPTDSKTSETINGISVSLNQKIINMIATINAGTATTSNYEDAGITGVTTANISMVNTAVSNAHATLTKEQIQEIVANLAINAGNATISDYRKAGIIGVTSANLADVNSAVSNAKVGSIDLTKADIQPLVNKIAIDTINAGHAIVSDYSTIGIIGVTDANLLDINSAVVIAKNSKGLNLDKAQIKIAVDEKMIELTAITAINAGSATANDYKAAGIIGVTSNNLAAVNGAVLNAENTKGSALTMSEIQAVVTGALPSGLEITKNNDTITAQLKKTDGADFTTSAAVVYEWYRGEAVISGQTQNTYELTNTDKGTSIKVKVQQYSLESNVINIPNDPVNQTTQASVTIKGTESVGNTLSAEFLDKDGNKVTTDSAVTYEWYRLDDSNSSFTKEIGKNKTYDLTNDDLGKYIGLSANYDGKSFTAVSGIIKGNTPNNSSSSSSKHRRHHDSTTTDSTTLTTTTTDVTTEADKKAGTTEGGQKADVTDDGKTNQTDGWIETLGKWKYLINGQPVIGWKQIDNKWYLFDKTGIMQVGWQEINKVWYLLKDSGEMATHWQSINGNWYFMKDNGEMATGWKEINGIWYLLKDDGKMAIGWQMANGEWYYLYSDGAMASNTVIDGYILGDDGGWIQ